MEWRKRYNGAIPLMESSPRPLRIKHCKENFKTLTRKFEGNLETSSSRKSESFYVDCVSQTIADEEYHEEVGLRVWKM